MARQRQGLGFVGMVAAGILHGVMPLSRWDEASDDRFVLDVREPFGLAVDDVPIATHIPVGQVRD